MPLNLGSANASSGESQNNYNGGFISFNGKSGRWSHLKDETKKEIQPPTFVADFDNIRTGWFKLEAGQAPLKVIDPALDQPAAQPKSLDPNKPYKRGFELDCYSDQLFGGVAQFGSNALGTCGAINELYSQYEAEREAHKGQLPVVKATGDVPITTKHGTNYNPTFQLVKWVDRPAAFSGNKASENFDEAPFDAPASSTMDVDSEF